MPVVFGPALPRLARTEDEADAEDAASPTRRESSPDQRGHPVTPRRVALGGLVAGAVAWLAARRGRGRPSPPLEPPFSR